MALARKPQEIVEDSNNPLLAKHESWERVPVGDIADILNGFAFKSSKFTKDKGTPLIRIRDVGKDSSETFYDGEYVETYLVNDGDLLVGMDGDFRAAIWKGGKALLNQRVCKISLKTDDYDFKFLSYVIQPYLDAIHAETSAVTVKHLSSNSIAEIPLPLPPKVQQKRIVAKTEELFSHIDAGIEALKIAKQLLKQYRQSVLKAAVTGELTKEWREANKDKLEPASQLLERILQERRQKWEEQQIEQFKAKGKMPKDDKWKEKYKEPFDLYEESFEIPEEWVWATVDQLGDVQLGRQRSPKNRSKDFPTKYIRAANITEEGLDFNDLLDMEFKPDEFERYVMKPNDLVLSEASGSPDQVGKPAIWKKEMPVCCFQNTVIRHRPHGVEPEYLLAHYKYFYWCRVFSKTAGGVGINHLSAQKFLKMSVSLPPILEQKEIVRRVYTNIDALNRLDAELNVQLVKAEKNKQSVLASVFSGNLL